MKEIIFTQFPTRLFWTLFCSHPSHDEDDLSFRPSSLLLISPLDKYNTDYAIHVSDSYDSICVEEIIEKYKEIRGLSRISEILQKVFSWNHLMMEMFKSV